MSLIENQLQKLKEELDRFTNYKDIVDHYILRIAKDKEINKSYPKITILLVDYKDVLEPKSEFRGCYAIDFRVQWFANEKLDGVNFSSFEDTDHFKDVRLHLYLFFKAQGPHLSSKLITFDVASYPDTETLLSAIREYFVQLCQMLDSEEFVGQRIAFSQAI